MSHKFKETCGCVWESDKTGREAWVSMCAEHGAWHAEKHEEAQAEYRRSQQEQAN